MSNKPSQCQSTDYWTDDTPRRLIVHHGRSAMEANEANAHF